MSKIQSQLPRTVMWRRIDIAGMEVCCFSLSDNGYLIAGTALYLHDNQAARLNYRVNCNSDWSCQSAWIGGWLGPDEREFSVERNADGGWNLDRVEIEGVKGLVDIDLGFTPSTNTNAIRRLGLAVGEEVESTAVWLDVDEWRFKPLQQAYHRVSDTEYIYRSPSHDYAATLLTDDFGIVREYPELWTAISEPGALNS